METAAVHQSASEAAECEKRFQAAVDVIQNLPKNGSYRPSYEVMLRFYSLYKQAMFGPCKGSRPGFWDPVGRYKWDAWSRLGDMNRECAMTTYVEEMKKVAQEVINNMPINEKTASFYHYFEPLYHVIHDMPRPPEALLSLRPDINSNETPVSLHEEMNGATREGNGQEKVTEAELSVKPVLNSDSLRERADMSSSDGLVLTSDSESEIFCDSVEQLDYIKPLTEPHSDQHGIQLIELGAGQGGEGPGDGQVPLQRRRDQEREAVRHGWREPGGTPSDSARRIGQQLIGGGQGNGPDRRSERLQETQMQQQIMLALLRLKEDMQSVMERLEVLEGLAAANAENAQLRTHMQTAALQTDVEKWWPFDVSGRTMLLLLIWPFIAQGMLLLLRQRKKKTDLSLM